MSILINSFADKAGSAGAKPVYPDFRVGDLLHRRAEIEKGHFLLCCASTSRLAGGIARAMLWYPAEK